MISTFRIDPVRDDHDLGVRPMIRPIRILGMAPLATIVAVLAACANPRADPAAYAQNALIGMPEDALLSCAGVPDRTARKRVVSGKSVAVGLELGGRRIIKKKNKRPKTIRIE